MKRKTFVQRLVAGILFLHLSITWLLAQPGGHHNLTVTGSTGREWGVRGVARTNGFGINFSDTYLNNKVETELSYFFNQNRVVQTDTTYVDDLNRESSNYSASSSLNHTMSHRIGGRITYRPTERDEVVIRPSLNFQQSDGTSASEDRSWNHHLSDVSIDRQPQKLCL